MSDVTFTPAQPSPPVRTLDDEANGTPAPYSRTPVTPAAPEPAPVGPPDRPLIDPESGDAYRPWTIGGVTVRCAAEIPIGQLTELLQLQAALPERNLDELGPADRARNIELLRATWTAVVWDEDIPIVDARLMSKRRPIGPRELQESVRDLYGLYSGGTGKEQ